MRWEEKLLNAIENTSRKYIDIKELEIGKVVSISPLQIINNDLPLYSNNLYINADLLENTRTFSSLTGTIGESSTTITNGSITFKSQLEIDDLVVMRKMSETMYVVLSKVEKGE